MYMYFLKVTLSLALGNALIPPVDCEWTISLVPPVTKRREREGGRREKGIVIHTASSVSCTCTCICTCTSGFPRGFWHSAHFLSVNF